MDALPVSAAGKVLKRALGERLEELEQLEPTASGPVVRE